MTPAKYVVVPRTIPAYGMVYDIVREGGKYPIAMTASLNHAKIAAAGFTEAEAESARQRDDLAQREHDWRMDHEKDREMRAGRIG